MARTVCPLCGETADDVSTKTIDSRRQAVWDMDVPAHLLNDDGALVTKEYEHGQSRSNIPDRNGLFGALIKVERRCTVALQAIMAARNGDLPKPIAPELADHRTNQGETGTPSAGCGTYPHTGDRRVTLNEDLTEVVDRPDADAIVDWFAQNE